MKVFLWIPVPQPAPWGNFCQITPILIMQFGFWFNFYFINEANMITSEISLTLWQSSLYIVETLLAKFSKFSFIKYNLDRTIFWEKKKSKHQNPKSFVGHSLSYPIRIPLKDIHATFSFPLVIVIFLKIFCVSLSKIICFSLVNSHDYRTQAGKDFLVKQVYMLHLNSVIEL